MKKIISALLLSFLGFGAFFAYADFDPAGWEYRSKISSDQTTDDFVVLQLPNDFFSYLKPDLSDLRIVDQDGEVPYVASAERESDVITAVPGRMFNLSSVRGEDTTFIVDVGSSGTFHNAVTIKTNSENFRRSVEIAGSDDQTNWRTLTTRGQIFDYTVRDIKPVSVKDTNLSYPDVTFRYLRVTVLDRGESPLVITGVNVLRRISTAARELVLVPARETTQDAEHRTTEIVLDLGTQGIPHRRGQLESVSTNFSRAIAIYDSDDKTDWRLLTHGYLFSIDTAAFRGSNLAFSYPESNRRYLRVSIQNGDDRPIAIGGATLFGVVRKILFRLNPEKETYAYLGNSRARRSEYDIEKIAPYVEAGALNQVSAGAVEKNNAFVPIVPPKPPLSERSPYVLPVILGVVVGVLAFLLLKIMGRVQMSGSDKSPMV